MHEIGILTGADLRAWPLADLEREFGKSAGYYYRAARAIDDRAVSNTRTRRSIGSERTFSENLLQKTQMLNVLTSLGDGLLESLTQRQLSAATVSVKVRFGDFETLTRAYTQAAGPIGKRSFDRVLPYLLDRALNARSKIPSNPRRAIKPGVRLLGVSFSTLSNCSENAPEQLEIDLQEPVRE